MSPFLSDRQTNDRPTDRPSDRLTADLPSDRPTPDPPSDPPSVQQTASVFGAWSDALRFAQRPRSGVRVPAARGSA